VIEAEDSEVGTTARRTAKSEAAFRTISEVSEDLEVPQHVLRFWESKFPQIKPLKRGGGRRYYRPEDVTLLRRIRDLLYKDGYTIRGVQKLLKEQGRPEAKRSAEAAPPAEHSAEDDPLIDPEPLVETGSEAAPHSSFAQPMFWESSEPPELLFPEPGERAAPVETAPEPEATVLAAPRRDRGELESLLAELEGLRQLLQEARSR
jgi:DNA-binding transcriptional MerR regulator